MTSDATTSPVHADPSAELDREIKAAWHHVCESLRLDLASLWQRKPDIPWMLKLTHYCPPLGGPPRPKPFDARKFFPWWTGAGAALRGYAVALTLAFLAAFVPSVHADL